MSSEPSIFEKFLITRYIVNSIRNVQLWYRRAHKLPIVVFYRYMWEKNKPLLFRTLFFNYVFQFILEILPWWASRRKVGNKLRTSRIKLNHNMVTGRDFKWKLMKDFIVKTCLFAILDSLNRYVKNRVALENKFEIRRLVLERILYAEIPELDKIKRSYSGSLEDRVASDITSTLDFINKYLPSLVSGIYAFTVEGSSLFSKRKTIEPLAFAYPILITIMQRVVSWGQYKWFRKAQKKISKDNNEKLDLAMTHALEGIIDIQTNNLQFQQLDAFDLTTQEEVRNKEGFANFVLKSLSALNKMSAFSYVIEIWCVHRIMKAGNLDHKQYSKIQQEIDHVVAIGRRALSLLRRTKHIFKGQSKVVKLLDITTFIDESSKFRPLDPYDAFRELVIDNVKFAYSGSDPKRQGLVLDLKTKLTFVPQKKYALIGQNRAGKSTLTKLITKLYAPSEGEIYWNGIPYSQIPRMALRDMISYIPQTPLIIGGTIRENILMGNPHATEQQILFAAEASGILDFLGVGANSTLSSSQGNISNSGFNGHYRSSSRSVGLLNMKSSSDRHKKSKKKKKKKKKKKNKSSDDDDEGSMSRTLSFAEIGEIVQPHGFYDSAFSTNKYPVNFDEATGDDSNSDSGSSGSSDDDDEDDNSESSSDQETKPLSTSSLTAASETTSDTQISKSNSDSEFDEEPEGDSSSTIIHSDNGSDSGSSSPSKSSLPFSASVPNLRWAAELIMGNTPRSSRNPQSATAIPKSSSSGNIVRMGRKSKALRAEQLRVLDTVLAAGGGDVSGGFAQSIALARVFVRTNAKVVILDESTSHMDPVKLRMTVFPKLLDFVEQWGMCLIVITHHFNSIRDFDHLVVMHEGTVVHEGTHDELVEQEAEMYLQLNPISNTMLSYHSRVDLSTLCENDDESFSEDDE